MRLRRRVRLEGAILEVMVSAPEPDNLSDLGLRSRSPPKGRFQTDEAPYWDRKTIVDAIGKVLSQVKGKAARNISPRIVYRPGRQGKGGSGVFAEPPAIFTRKFSQARLISPDKVSAAAATRAYLDEFVEDFEISIGEEYEVLAYITEVGVSLQKNIRPYATKKVTSEREWAKRYNARRGKAERKPKRKVKAKSRARVERGVRHRNRKKLGKVSRGRKSRKGR